MSRVSEMKLKVTNLAWLAQAAEARGLQFVEKPTYKLYGLRGGYDYELPKGMTVKDLGKCSYVLQIPNSPQSYEIGVINAGDGSYRLMADFDMDQKLNALAGEQGVSIIEEYEAVAFRETAMLQGYTVTESIVNGLRQFRAEISQAL